MWLMNEYAEITSSSSSTRYISMLYTTTTIGAFMKKTELGPEFFPEEHHRLCHKIPQRDKRLTDM